MNVFYRTTILAIACTHLCSAATTSYTVNFYAVPYPEPEITTTSKHPGMLQMRPGIMMPESYHETLMKHILHKPTTWGLAATLNGYLATADREGLLTFPRTTQQPQFYLMIGRMVPEYGLANNIEGWLIPSHEVADLYLVERKQDKQTELYYWDVKHTNIPSSGKVPLHTIVVFAKPEKVYVPIGITVTTNNPNLYLPDIYVKGGIDHLENALFILNIKQYFAPLRATYKKNKTGYQRWVGVEPLTK